MTRAKNKQTVDQDTSLTEVPLQSNSQAEVAPKEVTTSNMSDNQVVVPPDQVDWASLMNSFGGDRSPVLFIKGRHKIHLLPFKDANHIFEPVASFFKGKERTKYIVKVWNMDDSENPVRAALLPSKACKAILTLAVEGYELFDPKAGHAVILNKTGSGNQSEIGVTPSPKPIPVPPNVLELAEEMDLAQVAAEFSERQREREESGDNNKDTNTGNPAKESQEDW